MAEITPATVAKLREMTNAGMMDCKKALTEAQGDLDAAVDILRKKGRVTDLNRAGREAKEGVIAQFIQPGAKAGVLVEVNCETDFVAKNETFRDFCDNMAKRICADPKADLESLRIEQVSKIGEKIKISRHEHYVVQGSGLVAAYIHTGAKVGVLVEVGAGKDATVANEEFKQLVKDITLQIAAAHPGWVSRDDVPAVVIEKEDDINRQSDRLKGKPPQAMEKILIGMRDKFYQTHCLVDQGFVKNPDETIAKHVETVGATLGDQISVRRFVRFQVGESLGA